jgi:hypothetical protein
MAWVVNTSGKIIANYDILYRLTINSYYGGEIEGEDFYKAGEKAKWRIRNYNPPAASGIFGLIGIKLKPVSGEGTIVMDSPKEIGLNWEADFSSFTGPIVGFILGALIVWWITDYLRKRKTVQ